MLEPPLGGGAGERHVQRMPEPRRRVNLPETKTAPGCIAHGETADRHTLQFEIPGYLLAFGIDLPTAIRHAVLHLRTEPQLLANGQKPGPTARFVQCVVEIPRFGQH